jgi:hypothetical protein
VEKQRHPFFVSLNWRRRCEKFKIYHLREKHNMRTAVSRVINPFNRTVVEDFLAWFFHESVLFRAQFSRYKGFYLFFVSYSWSYLYFSLVRFCRLEQSFQLSRLKLQQIFVGNKCCRPWWPLCILAIGYIRWIPHISLLRNSTVTE